MQQSNLKTSITPTALITGASRGIGLEFANIFASQGTNLILVARSKQDLENLKSDILQKHNVSVNLIICDLTQKEQVLTLFNEVSNSNTRIDYLVNNAGFGDYASFAQSDWSRQESMINLNISALTHLCHLFIREWTTKKESGKILNVSSLASFMPGPNMSVYFATKAFVTSFSQALNHEVKTKGITVTALCPGPTHSHFAHAANVTFYNELSKSIKLPTSAQVAHYGYKAMMKGKSVATHGTINQLMVFFSRFMPRNLLTKISGRVMKWG